MSSIWPVFNQSHHQTHLKIFFSSGLENSTTAYIILIFSDKFLKIYQNSTKKVMEESNFLSLNCNPFTSEHSEKSFFSKKKSSTTVYTILIFLF